MKQLLAKLFMPGTLYDNGTNSPWDEQSGDESSGDEQSQNHVSLELFKADKDDSNFNPGVYKYFSGFSGLSGAR